MTSDYQQSSEGNEIDILLDKLADVTFDKWLEETNLPTSGNIKNNEQR